MKRGPTLEGGGCSIAPQDQYYKIVLLWPLEVTPTNPKSYPVSKDLGCVVNLVSRSLCRLGLSVSLLPRPSATQTQEKGRRTRDIKRGQNLRKGN